eukprot:NODE_3628_length_762_cov_177.988685.p1 GENE.NODE_3628_length_762_cov_177.988685~~NODE_3628_length_762_cov_177.988685.p1  ORF type:complete len:208 (+),score=70.55 NODE_3628_length_762_cov_177.988685:59-625(+)
MAISGLTADGRSLHKYLFNECLEHQYVYNSPINIGRLVARLSDWSQKSTQTAGGRPFGVGLLLAGVDETGPHVYETCPSGNFFEYSAYAIGERNQGARTYLEKNADVFAELSLDELIQHGLKALSATQAEKDLDLDSENVSVACIGIGQSFMELPSGDLKERLSRIAETTGAAEEGAAAAPAAPAAAD